MAFSNTKGSALLALGLSMIAAPVIAGGPLVVVPTGNGVKAAHWEGVVNVYTDLGTLGVVDNALANQLVRKSLHEWSSVPTSSFRAKVVGTMADIGLADITGANAGSVIGADNGGGIHVIYDADGTVLEDFFGVGGGVLGIATPEFLAREGSTTIVEGWVIITAQGEGVEGVVTGAPLAGIITHEFGHSIGLAHTQTNGLYFRNQPIAEWGLPAGPERAGPDQCAPTVTSYPSAEQVETMFPFIDPYPFSPTYNSPGMATVNVADDKAALSWLYPAPNYRRKTGTIVGRVVAKDGVSELTGINVIARNVASPFDAISRISGDRTQGAVGADGAFEITGLTPGARYVIYIDEIGAGGFSTPKAILLGPEEYWNAAESANATVDDACAATKIVLAAGETRRLEIAMNGISRAPTFTHLPYSLPIDLSDNGERVVGLYGPFQSPYWRWSRQRGMENIDGVGFMGAVSGDGRTIGGTITKRVDTEYGPVDQERAAVWSRATGWESIADESFKGCDIFHTSVFDVNRDGSAAVGLAFEDCSNAHAYKWTARGGMRRLGKTSVGAARANAVSGDGRVVGGWEEIPEAFGFRVGALWQGQEQMLITDREPQNPYGYVGEVMAVNGAGSKAVGYGAGAGNKDAYLWTSEDGMVNIGRYAGRVCYMYVDWETGQETEICEDRETVATSMSSDGRIITGASRLTHLGVDDAVLYTHGLGWMLMSEFLASQGVLEMSRWKVLGARVSADGKTLTGTAFPLAADYYHGYRLELDQVFVCHDKHRGGRTLRVGFPDAMDKHLEHGDTIGLCFGDAPL
ncbi:MAG TPA: hypothetical protein VFO35_05855 [Steroidobacteraceae bacterium]|nr:hypothetical protein [Steroidobacteraceae bacterium]